MTKPADGLPEWATSSVTLPQGGVPNKSTTDPTMKTQGFDYLTIPEAPEENYWRNLVYLWIQHLEGITDTNATDVANRLLNSNNLSDVNSAATAFSNIKQAATTSATGVVELAIQDEVDTGTDPSRVVTPLTLQGKLDASVLGYNQTYQDVKTSPGRSLGVQYTNSTGAAIFIVVQTTDATGDNSGHTLLIDGNTIANPITENPSDQPGRLTGTYIIPNGSTYQVDGQAGDTLSLWWELR